MSEEEQRYGQGSFEQAQGFKEMPMANPEPDPEPAMTERELAHFQRPAEADFGELTERTYTDSNDNSKRRDEHETVEIGRASDDLRDLRKQEKAARERELNDATSEAVDALRRQVTEQPPHQQPQPQQQQPDPQLELQAEQADPAQIEATIAEADREIAKFLENPAVRQRVEQEFAAVNQAASAQVEQAKAAYGQAITQNAMAALAILAVDFPEYAGLSGPELQGALKVSNPQRAEAYRQRVGQVNNVVGAIQREVAQHQQQQQALQVQQLARNWQELEQYKLAEDKKFDAATANENPETMKALRQGSFEMLERHYGIPQTRMRALASGQERIDSAVLLHSSEFQRILVDALKFRMTQQSLAKAVTRPVPQVQRPGVSQPYSSDDGAYAAIERQFRGKDLNPKQAAELLIARRGARG